MEPWEQEVVDRLKARGNLPRHVAVIMDGNGRWAKQRGLERIQGHQEGINSVRAVVEACGALGIEVLTLYTFSTENWKRPRREVMALMRLLIRTVQDELDELDQNNVRLKTIGRLEDLPGYARRAVEKAIERLRDNTGLTVVLALSYSGREEIAEAARRAARDVLEGKIRPDDLSPDLFATYLQTAGLPDPDLLIRTSGEMRLSNFLLWQLAYTELYITDVLWPDFRKREFYAAIEEYQRRERRFGMVSEQLHAAPGAPEPELARSDYWAPSNFQQRSKSPR
ncbi:MAG: isoprenyl transferase [candidate division KSB1 bacterium]|nr:isoprenyl transferase [candidate division KSB1 bacterium]